MKCPPNDLLAAAPELQGFRVEIFICEHWCHLGVLRKYLSGSMNPRSGSSEIPRKGVMQYF